MPVRTNVSAFLAKYKDIQRTTSLIFEGLVVTGNFNAAAATLYGTQVDVLLRPLPGFDLQGSYGYLHTKYDSFEIGRASCRDRVCQYGYIAVVAGSLKKN